MELRVQAQEVAKGEDDHFLGVSVHPLLYLCQNSLSRMQTAASEAFFSAVWWSFVHFSLPHIGPSKTPLEKSDFVSSPFLLQQNNGTTNYRSDPI